MKVYRLQHQTLTFKSEYQISWDSFTLLLDGHNYLELSKEKMILEPLGYSMLQLYKKDLPWN